MAELFTAGGAHRCLVSTFRALSAGEGRASAHVQLASSGYDAPAPTYGRLPADLDTALAQICPVVASCGGRDRSLRDDAAKPEATLTRLGVERDVKEYLTASHAFLNDDPVGPEALRPVSSTVLGMALGPAAANAWRCIEAFFAERLVTRMAGTPGER